MSASHLELARRVKQYPDIKNQYELDAQAVSAEWKRKDPEKEHIFFANRTLFAIHTFKKETDEELMPVKKRVLKVLATIGIELGEPIIKKTIVHIDGLPPEYFRSHLNIGSHEEQELLKADAKAFLNIIADP